MLDRQPPPSWRAERDATTFKAIDTAYGGRLFRSRLEARWAVFYDAIKIPWIYEPEGFALGDVRYLPDFYLPGLDCYIEIKPVDPTAQEYHKAVLLARHTGRRVFIFVGQPGHHINDGYPSGQTPSFDSAYVRYGEQDEGAADGFDDSFAWCVCQTCGRFGIEFMGRSERICRHPESVDEDYSYDDPGLLRAYDAANRARFGC